MPSRVTHASWLRVSSISARVTARHHPSQKGIKRQSRPKDCEFDNQTYQRVLTIFLAVASFPGKESFREQSKCIALIWDSPELFPHCFWGHVEVKVHYIWIAGHVMITCTCVHVVSGHRLCWGRSGCGVSMRLTFQYFMHVWVWVQLDGFVLILFSCSRSVVLKRRPLTIKVVPINNNVGPVGGLKNISRVRRPNADAQGRRISDGRAARSWSMVTHWLRYLYLRL